MCWHKLTTREIEEEEKEYFPGCCYMWDGPTPELFEKVLVSRWKNKDEAYVDEWIEFDVGVGFEDTDIDFGDTIYWCQIPEFEEVE